MGLLEGPETVRDFTAHTNVAFTCLEHRQSHHAKSRACRSCRDLAHIPDRDSPLRRPMATASLAPAPPPGGGEGSRAWGTEPENAPHSILPSGESATLTRACPRD